MPTAILLSDLTKTFDRGVTAVDRISLSINPGELFFLLGPSGCGKTTLLRMIAGFIEPTSGSIAFDNGAGGGAKDVTFLSPNKRNTGMVFQSYALWPHMSVAANVAFGLDVRRIPAEEKSRRVREALAAVHMEDYADRRPNQLSGGQQQRVALARALVIRPDVLLLDEPLSNLDAKLRIELRSEIRRICKEAAGREGVGGGITTVYVTHDQKEALSMADRVAVIDRGRVAQLGTPSDLYSRPRSRFVAEFLGETNIIPAEVMDISKPATVPLPGDSGGRRLAVQTPAGRVVSTQISDDLPADPERVLLSIRPEAFRVNAPDGTNNIFAKIIESTYLGETAQLLVEAQGGLKLKVAILNPSASLHPGDRLTLSAATHDAVALPA